MRAVADPGPARGDPLAGSDRGGVADHHHEVALAPHLHLEHAEAVLRIVEGDALDAARQSLKRGPPVALGWSKHLVHGASRSRDFKDANTPGQSVTGMVLERPSSVLILFWLFWGHLATPNRPRFGLIEPAPSDRSDASREPMMSGLLSVPSSPHPEHRRPKERMRRKDR